MSMVAAITSECETAKKSKIAKQVSTASLSCPFSKMIYSNVHRNPTRSLPRQSPQNRRIGARRRMR